MFGIEKIFAPKSFIGCDIGTTSIKTVELHRSGTNSQVVNYALLESMGHFERANNVIQANDLKISEDETVKLLKMMLRQAKFSTTNVIASIPTFASFTTLLELPEMTQEETIKSMPFQIKQNIPLPLSEIAVDWIRVGQREDEGGFIKQQIFLVAIPNEIIERYKNIFRRAGLSLKALEVEPFAYARAVVGNDQTATLILDIGARSTNISVVEKGFLKQNQQVDYAGDSLTLAVSKGLGISQLRAEELKKQRGLSGGQGEYELSTLEMPFIDAILHEVSKVKGDFEKNFSSSIQRVLIIGGGAGLTGIDRYVESRINIPSMLGNGLLYAQLPSDLNNLRRELETRFALAIGLGIKGFIS